MNTITITFADDDDRKNFLRYIEKVKQSPGTVTGLYAGLSCAALKRASIELSVGLLGHSHPEEAPGHADGLQAEDEARAEREGL